MHDQRSNEVEDAPPPPGSPTRLFIVAGCLLAAIAGLLNTALLALGHEAVTHLTGILSRLSADAAEWTAVDGVKLTAIIASFFLGAVLTGILLDRSDFAPHRRYDRVILLEAALLFLAWFLYDRSSTAMLALAATAAGLQNAMFAQYAGLVIRTTHLTGVITELAFLVGQAIRRRHANFWQFGLLSLLLLGFMAGGAAGVFAADRFQRHVLLIPASILLLAAAVYATIRQVHVRHQPQSDDHRAGRSSDAPTANDSPKPRRESRHP